MALESATIAVWINETAQGHKTVPKALVSSLKWLYAIDQPHWDLCDPVIQALEYASIKDAARQRKQAVPYNHETVTALLQAFGQARGPAHAYAVGFLILLATAVLRFSDLHRTGQVALNDDAIYGTSWKSKNKPGAMPWAAFRALHTGADIGVQFCGLICGNIPGDRREGCFHTMGWLWPHMHVTAERVPFSAPIRQGSYDNGLKTQA